MRSCYFLLFLIPYTIFAQQTVDFSQLDEKWNSELKVRTYSLDGKPFTGKVNQTFEDHPGRFEYEMLDGFIVVMLGYYEGGELERRFHFKAGKEHGILTMYFPDGQKYIEEEYHEGKANGTFMRWYNDGRVAHRKVFEMGNLVSEAYY